MTSSRIRLWLTVTMFVVVMVFILYYTSMTDRGVIYGLKAGFLRSLRLEVFWEDGLGLPPDRADSIFHGFAYFLLAVSSILLLRRFMQEKYVAFAAVLFLLLFATFDELHQNLIAERQASLIDFATDIVGASWAFAGYFLMQHWRRRGKVPLTRNDN